MSDMPAPVASAVVVPKSDAPAPRSPRRKRRQSSASEETSKRPRISPDPTSESPSTLRSSPHAVDPPKQDTSKPEPLGISAEGSKNVGAERRKSSVQEERRRGQRLFGGLLIRPMDSRNGDRRLKLGRKRGLRNEKLKKPIGRRKVSRS
ncbi:hypothetical protein CJF30_00007635 [Rutstroemia sp. NJR-2017a BBW]|nr:hypothetical protein CJF30_00007635 [Rutstroemia sp. NJR-2017a BBW]